MPTDLLLPAFALVLVANAAIVLIALRSLREERRAPAGRPITPSRPSPTPPVRAARPRTAEPAAERIVSQAAEDPAPGPALARDPTAPAAPPAVSAPPAVPAPVDPGPAPRAKGGRRRKFSLPPLDEDHEKVSRSIESFLTGTDATPAAPLPPATPIASPPPIVTVAAIQMLGEGPRDVLERTVRSTARATDQVTVDRRGRVRVVLVGSGELAAHAYLRRIRATVEPIVEAADPNSRIVVATATELDGAIATARRRVDRRLAVALRTAAPAAGVPIEELEADEEPEPLVAGD